MRCSGVYLRLATAGPSPKNPHFGAMKKRGTTLSDAPKRQACVLFDHIRCGIRLNRLSGSEPVLPNRNGEEKGHTRGWCARKGPSSYAEGLPEQCDVATVGMGCSWGLWDNIEIRQWVIDCAKNAPLPRWTRRGCTATRWRSSLTVCSPFHQATFEFQFQCLYETGERKLPDLTSRPLIGVAPNNDISSHSDPPRSTASPIRPRRPPPLNHRLRRLRISLLCSRVVPPRLRSR